MDDNVVPFVPLAEQPHHSEMLRCQMCAYVAVHVWPERTPIRALECAGCGRTGTLIVSATGICICGHAQIDHVLMELIGCPGAQSLTCRACYAKNTETFCTEFRPL